MKGYSLFLFPYLLVFYLIPLFIGCKSSPTHPISSKQHALDLTSVEQIKLGSKKEDVEKYLGKPDKIITSSIKEELWIYLNKQNQMPRATFVIERASGVLISKVWEVWDNDPEQNVETALKRYSNANFKRFDPKIVNPHVGPDQVFFEDQTLGISIKIRKKRNEVDSITWLSPGAPIIHEEPACIKVRKKNGLVSCKNK